jgi:hypothetical protein
MSAFIHVPDWPEHFNVPSGDVAPGLEHTSPGCGAADAAGASTMPDIPNSVAARTALAHSIDITPFGW